MGKAHVSTYFIVRIYNKNLSAIQVDGSELYDYRKGKQDYVYFVNASNEDSYPMITATAESPRAVVQIKQATADHPVAEIKVLHDDVFAGEASPETYTIHFVRLPLNVLTMSVGSNP